MLLNYKLFSVAPGPADAGGPRAVRGVAAPSTENHRSFVGGVVRSGAKRTRGDRTSRLDHVAFDRDRTGRHLQIWM